MVEWVSPVHLGEASEAQHLASTGRTPHHRQQLGASAHNVKSVYDTMSSLARLLVIWNHLSFFLAASPVACGVRGPGRWWVVGVKGLALEGRVLEPTTDELGQLAAQH